MVADFFFCSSEKTIKQSMQFLIILIENQNGYGTAGEVNA